MIFLFPPCFSCRRHPRTPSLSYRRLSDESIETHSAIERIIAYRSEYHQSIYYLIRLDTPIAWPPCGARLGGSSLRSFISQNNKKETIERRFPLVVRIANIYPAGIVVLRSRLNSVDTDRDNHGTHRRPALSAARQPRRCQRLVF